MGSIHDRTEKECIDEALEQLVICAEAAHISDCLAGFVLLRTDNGDTVDDQDNEDTNEGTRTSETNDKADELDFRDIGDMKPSENMQFTPAEDGKHDEHIATSNMQRITEDDSRPTTSSFTQADVMAALFSLSSSQWLLYFPPDSRRVRQRYLRIERGYRGNQR